MQSFHSQMLVDGITFCSAMFFSLVFRLGLKRQRSQVSLPSVFVCELCVGLGGPSVTPQHVCV